MPKVARTRLSDWASKGDWRLFFLHRDRLEKVTAADVNRVAAAYMKPSNRTLGVFVPTKDPQRAGIPETPAVAKLLDGYKGRTALGQGEAFEPTPANLDARLKKTQIGAIKVGMLQKKTRGETVTLQMVLRFGNEESLKGRKYAIDLMADMIGRGTKKHSRQEIQDKLDKLGTQMRVTAEPGALLITVRAKRAGLAETLESLREILREPTFSPKEFDLLKAEARDALDKQRTDPLALGQRELRQQMTPYAKDHPLHVPSIEEELQGIAATTLAEVEELYATQVSAQAGEVAALGDFEPTAFLTGLRPILADWSSNVPHRRIPRLAHPEVEGVRKTINTPDKPNAVFMAGLSFAVGDSHPDFVALDVGNFLFGGASSSRLVNRVRQKEGLSYGVRSQYSASPRDPASRLIMYAISNAKNAPKVDAAIADELEKYLADGPSGQELNDAKLAYLEAKKVSRTTDPELAMQMINALSLDRPFGFYAEQERKASEVSPDEVKAAFRKYVNPKKLVIIQAGDFGPPKK